MVAAGDTFRAGAIDQLRVWAERTGAEFVGAKPGTDPAAVAFDAIDAAIARGVDVLIIDTAGRLHTSDGLMEELKKVARVIAKRLPGAPHETLLVLDGTIGQNAVQQAKIFAAAVPVSGLVVTKLDGTARGGVVVAVHEAIDVPVKFLGVGESAADLMPFEAAAFAQELLSGDEVDALAQHRRTAQRLYLDTSVTYLKGVGPARADALRRLGIVTAGDLLFHVPHRYEDASTIAPIKSLEPGMDGTIVGTRDLEGRHPDAQGAANLPGRAPRRQRE